jgi:hypothetical protein
VEKKTDILSHHEVLYRLGGYDSERGESMSCLPRILDKAPYSYLIFNLRRQSCKSAME